ncbi:MAG: glyoxylate/hydroxypyruvate reductase A, partial [Variibacter sp.]|nr:glyoxylate/hydroxypyruvate reductase A [Variibacter sp.]
MPNAILIAVDGATQAEWYEHFRPHAYTHDLRFWPDAIGDADEIADACCWRAPHGLFAQFPNLKAIFNLGAGVDHLLADPALPAVPVARAVHPDLTMRMTEYVVLHVLLQHRRQRRYDAQQRARTWAGLPQPAASEVAVGIMGIGAIGADAAAVLRRIGFQVAGWSRSPKRLDGVEVFHGPAGLDRFLARTEILVCLLPHT